MLSNKARFILEIIEGKLVISNKKRAEVIKLLKSRSYDEAVIKKPQENATEEDPENQEDEDSTDTKGFNYLLEMPISNLTHEKVCWLFCWFLQLFGSKLNINDTQVQKLLAERDAKEGELSQLLDKTPASLWEVDLDSILARWEDLLADDERTLKSVIKAKTSKLTSKKKPAPKKKASKSNDDGSDDDDIVEDEDDDENEYQGIPSFLQRAPFHCLPLTLSP